MTDVSDVLELFEKELEKRTPKEQRKYLTKLGFVLDEEPKTEYLNLPDSNISVCRERDVVSILYGSEDISMKALGNPIVSLVVNRTYKKKASNRYQAMEKLKGVV